MRSPAVRPAFGIVSCVKEMQFRLSHACCKDKTYRAMTRCDTLWLSHAFLSQYRLVISCTNRIKSNQTSQMWTVTMMHDCTKTKSTLPCQDQMMTSLKAMMTGSGPCLRSQALFFHVFPSSTFCEWKRFSNGFQTAFKQIKQCGKLWQIHGKFFRVWGFILRIIPSSLRFLLVEARNRRALPINFCNRPVLTQSSCSGYISGYLRIKKNSIWKDEVYNSMHHSIHYQDAINTQGMVQQLLSQIPEQYALVLVHHVCQCMHLVPKSPPYSVQRNQWAM